MPDDPDEFIESSIPLPANHAWQCKPGNQLFVADRGAAAFEVPQGWVIRHDGKTLTLHDQPPPADQARISFTVFRLPPVKGGWRQLPLEKMFAQTMADPPAKLGKKSATRRPALEIHRAARPDPELVWAEKEPWIDPDGGRPIRCRQILARARLVQVLMTFDVYQDTADAYEPVWDDLLATLKLGVPRDLTGHVGN